MKKPIKMPSIEQFRNVVQSVERRYTFVGLDENGDGIYDPTLPKPTLTFKGTVKLHGTNASVAYNKPSGMWYQSKDSIITPQDDNAGFAFFADNNCTPFLKLMLEVAERENIDRNTNTITIYGEWCGGKIQKGVGICNLPKSFFIFGVKVTPIVDQYDNEAVNRNPAYWVSSSNLRLPEYRIFNIEDYPTYTLDIDFNNPSAVQTILNDLTLAVESDCPVARAFGFPETLGEGIVWICNTDEEMYRFKTKGDKHASSKGKTIGDVDIEKLNTITEFIDYAVTESRFNQALENTFPNQEPIDIKKMGDLIKWVVNDVIKEESDTLAGNNLEPKEVNKYISTRVREMFFKLSV